MLLWNLVILQMLFKNTLKNSFLCDWSMFPSVQPPLAAVKLRQIYLSRWLSKWFLKMLFAFSDTFQGKIITLQDLWREALKGFCELVSNFIEAIINIDFDFENNKNCNNHPRIYIKYRTVKCFKMSPNLNLNYTLLRLKVTDILKC